MGRDLLELVRSLSTIQSKLVKELLAAKAPRDLEYFRDLAYGTIELEGDPWHFRRHGAGVTFRSERGIVVNAHVAMVEVPEGIDAWRLLLYLESVGVQEVLFNGRVYSIIDERTLDGLLSELIKIGKIEAVAAGRERTHHLYRPIA